jgi:hypothetical protein
MKNPESHTEVAEVVDKHGRELVPPGSALEAQKNLVMLYLTPERIIPYINFDDEYDPIMDALMFRYMDMYDSGDYNGFAEFCEEADEELMDRIVNQELTPNDYLVLKNSLESHDGGAPFFKDDKDIEDFIKANTH